MTTVSGKYSADLNIGGIDINPDAQRVPVLEMRAGVQRALPTLTVDFFDRNADVSEALGGIKDGTSISAAIDDGKGGPNTSASFRVMGNPELELVPQGLRVKINAVLENIGWMRKVVDFHLPQAPSSAMIAQMAGLAGLIPDVDMTSDIQTWLPNRQPLVKYAEMVMQRAHSGSGAMIMATTLDGRLRYKILSALIGTGSVVLGGPLRSGNEIPYVHWGTQATGAVQNATGGYGITSMAEGISGVIDELSKMEIPFPGGEFGVGAGNIEAMGSYGTRILHMGTDGGNTHENYYKAQHSNIKEKSAWTNDVNVLTVFATGLDILDGAYFRAFRPITMEEMSAYSGKYIVTNVVKGVRNGSYFEKLTLTNTSP